MGDKGPIWRRGSLLPMIMTPRSTKRQHFIPIRICPTWFCLQNFNIQCRLYWKRAKRNLTNPTDDIPTLPVSLCHTIQTSTHGLVHSCMAHTFIHDAYSHACWLVTIDENTHAAVLYRPLTLLLLRHLSWKLLERSKPVDCLFCTQGHFWLVFTVILTILNNTRQCF